MQIDRRCGSGLQAVIDAAMRVQTGICELVIAGGAESMSQAEHYALGLRCGLRGADTNLCAASAVAASPSGGKNYPLPGGMLETAENLRREFRSPGSAGRLRSGFACQGRSRPARRAVRRRDRASHGRGPARARVCSIGRASARRCQPGVARSAAPAARQSPTRPRP